MLKIVLTVDNATNLDTAQLDTEPTPGSINAVTSGGIFTYCETKLKAISDRIDNISSLVGNLATPAELSNAIAKLQARESGYYDGCENLVYTTTKGDGTWTSVVGQEYPAYQLAGGRAEESNYDHHEPFTPKSTPYAIYRCIEPSTCTAKYYGSDPSWSVEETPGKFEFVRWEY